MPPTNRAAVADAIRANSTAMAVDLVEPFAHVLQIARQVFGDGDKLLLMSNITLRANLHPAYKALSPDDIAAGRIARLPTLGVNLQSLADATGIPKETVRRKVAQLARDGFIERDGRNLRYTPQGYRAVAPIREALVRMAARIHQAVETVVAEELVRAA
jgi:DNA-binding MarR family transcriptional regulator